jgi:hypothetical protein
MWAHSLMVERTAHNGSDVGSNPPGPKLKNIHNLKYPRWSNGSSVGSCPKNASSSLALGEARILFHRGHSSSGRTMAF